MKRESNASHGAPESSAAPPPPPASSAAACACSSLHAFAKKITPHPSWALICCDAFGGKPPGGACGVAGSDGAPPNRMPRMPLLLEEEVRWIR